MGVTGDGLWAESRGNPIAVHPECRVKSFFTAGWRDRYKLCDEDAFIYARRTVHDFS
jgi:hypothetical protein